MSGALIRIGLTNQGEQEVALGKAGVKTPAKGKATTSKVAKSEGTKVTRAFVAKLNEFVETRSLLNLYTKAVEEGRTAIFAEVGKEEQVLIHNGVEVAIIAKVVKPDIDRKLLAEKYPEAFAACSITRDEFHIRKATPKK